MNDLRAPTDEAVLKSLGVRVALAAIYEGVALGAEPEAEGASG